MNDEERRKTWQLYFLTTVGWSMHPGYQKPNAEILTLEYCEEIADAMLKRTEARWAPSGEQ